MISSCKCSRIQDFGMTPEGMVAGSTSAVTSAHGRAESFEIKLHCTPYKALI